MSTTISMEDIIIAYRKAKADAFYDHGHLTSLKFAEYEENLHFNLSAFEDKINRRLTSWVEEDDFTGTYTFTLKKAEPDKKEDDETSGFFFYSSSERNWKNVSKITADFRLIGLHSVEFHILSSLWIEKVGRFLEEKMSTNCYGCRLKRATVKDESGPDFIYTPTANRKEKTHVGHFRPYLRDYQEWQYKGITEIKKALSEGRKIVAVTSDFAKYYHRIDCSFIQTEDFLQYLKVDDYSPLQRKLTILLVKAIKAWSDLVYQDERVPAVFKHNGHCGVPMGIGASKVIANLLLTFFDKAVEKEIKPIYYGRYVDDIFLVIEDGENIITAADFWEFLQKRIDDITLVSNSQQKNSKELNPQEYEPKNHTLNVPYSKGSLLEFSKGKEKYFFLEGKGGEAFLKTLKESLDEHSSEWKLPPDSEEDVENFSQAMTDASSSSGESANGLRKSDGLSIQRMKFILYLKRFEVAIDLLPKKVWQKALKDFFSVVSEYTITPGTIGSFSRYYPRVLSLAVKAKDREALAEIYTKTLEMYKELGSKDSSGNLESDDFQYCIKKAMHYQKRLLLEGIYSSLDPSSTSDEELDPIIDRFLKKEFGNLNPLEAAKKLFVSDLHRRPFKDAFIYELENTPFSQNVFTLFDNFQFRFEDPPHYREFSILVKQLAKGSKLKKVSSTSPPKALYFYTRPFTILELTIVFPNWLKLPNIFKAICDFYHIVWEHPEKIEIDKLKDRTDYKAYRIKSPYKNSNRSFALTSMETKNESWMAIVREDGFEPDINRIQRILDLARDIVTCSKEINYVVFPELSLPRKLLLYLSGLFLFRKISLIAGFEYQSIVSDTSGLPATSSGFVSNQLIYVLCVANQYGLHQVSLRQEKVLPALEEERLLFDVGGKHLKAINQSKLLINHDNFWFSGLICNDFLNIDNRAILRGLIDALVVIEWNKDVNTYNALVEASANDIHTFVLQINNRLYGDTRLRAPYKEDFRRDVVRVRGGELDYFVVATLEVKELRKFQSYHRSPEKPFKPVPTGFEILPERKYSFKDVNKDDTDS